MKINMKIAWNFPKTVKAYYVKLYLKRNKKTNNATKLALKEAKKSWHSLEPQEKQMFIKKYNESYQQYETNYAEYLKTFTPDIDKNIIVSDSDIVDIHVSFPSKSAIPTNNTIDEIQASTHAEFSATMTDSSVLDQDILSNTREPPRPDSAISSQFLTQANVKGPPKPPAIKSGSDLYYMLNSHIENGPEFATLGYGVMRRYESASVKIKNNYIKEYEGYLNSLTSRELHGHMLDILGEDISSKFFSNYLGVL